MRKTISEFLEPKDDQKAIIWNQATFVFDTNVLLNLYRYTSSTRTALLEALKNLKSVWLPHQVIIEFMNRRSEVVFETVNRYEKLQDNCTTLVNEIVNQLRLSKTDDSIIEFSNFTKEWLDKKKNDDLIVTHPNDDVILNDLLYVFDKNTGNEFTEKQLDKIFSEGKDRYANQIPPGYKDCSKDSPNRIYGDLILWKQIIDFARDSKKDIVFITHD